MVPFAYLPLFSMARTVLHNRDWALFILRLAVAAIFLYHGTQKWVFWGPEAIDIPSYMLWIMRALAVAEPLAAVALLAGWKMHAAALGLMIVMAAALTMKIRFEQPFPAWELEFLTLAACTVLLTFEPGSLSFEASKKAAPSSKKKK
jgi:uncharacterized membrane protein YphA (DoxX/SURF4 family)